jgi:hypothetical protein
LLKFYFGFHASFGKRTILTRSILFFGSIIGIERGCFVVPDDFKDPVDERDDFTGIFLRLNEYSFFMNLLYKKRIIHQFYFQQIVSK